MNDRDHIKRDRAVFDRDPELFDRVRPDYPPELFETIVDRTGLRKEDQLLEIGCGTGRSTFWFATRGFSITAVEMGRKLSAFATRRFRHLPNVRVVNDSFENFNCGELEFDLVFAGNAFHWLNKDMAYAKTAASLRNSGHLALFWSDLVITDRSREQVYLVETAYEKIIPEWSASFKEYDPEAVNARREKEIRDSGLFAEIQREAFQFEVTYNSSDYILLLSTTSDHGALDETVRNALFSEISRVIDERCGGSFTKEYLCTLFLARKAI